MSNFKTSCVLSFELADRNRIFYFVFQGTTPALAGCLLYLRPIGLVQLRCKKVTYALEFQLRHCVVVKPLLLWVKILLCISL